MNAKDRMYRDRLLYLADFAETIPPERFNFKRFTVGWAGSPTSCGTCGCVLGHACSDRKFQRLGLHFSANEGWERGRIAVGDDVGRYAPGKLFGLDVVECDFLFIPQENHRGSTTEEHLSRYGRTSPPGISTAKQVASHIRWFVKFKYGTISKEGH